MILPPLCLLELRLTALAPIRKLPRFHGAQWSACLRHLLRRATGGEPGDVWVVLPGSSTSVIERGEPLHLGLVFAPEMTRPVVAALAGWNRPAPSTGHFQPGVTVSLEEVRCRISGALWDPAEPAYLSEKHLGDEIKLLQTLDRFTLRLDTPLRLTRPAGNKQGGHRYCDAAFFTAVSLADREKIAAITCRLRGSIDGQSDTHLHIAGGALDWQDVTYGTGFKKTIGGIVGEIVLTGRCSPATAAQLVAGQYLGAGKNAAFGFGFYTVPELEPVRCIAQLAGGVTVDLASPDIAVCMGR